jgi:D-ornithine 4,5-aminomutase subunit alpha
MSIETRADDFQTRRRHLQSMSDDELHSHFWSLVEKVTAPLVEEARTHTSPSIERSVLLRMGFSSVEAKALVDAFIEHDLLSQGTGRLVLELASAKGIPVRDAGEALLQNRCWEELTP